KLLLSIDEASKPADAEWVVIYNDSTVAKEVNDKLKTKRVIFVGGIFENKTSPGSSAQEPEKKLNWHGPGQGATGLKLHFHLDYVPKMNKDPDAASIRFAHSVAKGARDIRGQVLSILGVSDSPAPVKKKGKTK